MFGDKDLLTLPDEELRRIRGNDIAMIFQDPLSSLHPFYKVGAQLVEAVLTHRSVGKAAARARALELLELVGIPDPKRRIDAYPHQYSGGMRQRAMIAMALANEPKLLFADEPTTALDVTVQAQILQLLEELQQRLGMAIVIITHDLGVVAEIADEIARHVRRADRRAGADKGDLLRAPAPLHLGPAAIDPASGHPPRRGADADPRSPAEPDPAPLWLLFPSPLSIRADRTTSGSIRVWSRSQARLSIRSRAC